MTDTLGAALSRSQLGDQRQEGLRELGDRPYITSPRS